MNDEEVAFRIVRLYFQEIARLGFKRQLDIDQIINAYFYTLKKLGNKDVAMREAVKKIIEEEKKDTNNSESSRVESTVSTTTKTSTQSQEEPRERSISEIVEDK